MNLSCSQKKITKTFFLPYDSFVLALGIVSDLRAVGNKALRLKVYLAVLKNGVRKFG